jgi:primase-polymerase (primpol)-like protein
MNPAAIPSVLQAERQWVVARLEHDPARPKPVKMPYQATDTKARASHSNPGTWSTFDVAVSAIERESSLMLGYVFNGRGHVGIDLDGCRNPSTGQIAEWAHLIILGLDSYTELSQSGTGVHVIADGLDVLPTGGRRTGKDGARPPVPAGCELEIYDRARYFVVTGDHLPGTPAEIVDSTDALQSLVQGLFESSAAPRASATFRQGPPLSDDDVVRGAANASNGAKFARLVRGDLSDYHGDHSSADLALVGILLWWTRGDRDQADRLFRHSNLMREKWNRVDYRERTFRKAEAGRG